MEDIIFRMKKLRKDKNMSMGMFAGSVGYSKAYISYIEANVRPITDTIADKIIKTHSLNKDWFIFGRGEMYDRERAARKEAYYGLIRILKQFHLSCGYFSRLLRPHDFSRISAYKSTVFVFDLCHNISMDNFYHSEISPKQLVTSIISFYQEIEHLLSRCIKLIQLIKDESPNGFREFYLDNENEKLLIDQIESELLACRKLYTDCLNILRKNTDDNDLLDITGHYNRLYKTLSYKQNIEIIRLMQDKMNQSKRMAL